MTEAEKTLLKQLKNPFDPKFVKWRIGATNKDKTKGIALAYIDSREVLKRLDDVCGVGGWQNRQIAVDGGFVCDIGIKIGDDWIWKSNAAGHTKVEALKGGASDAFKRAASTWGIGRYLYYMPNIWVAIKQTGTNSRGEAIYSLGEQPELPDWALPGKVDRWEDVAAQEVDTSASADPTENFEATIGSLDEIRAARNEEELDAIVSALSEDQQLLLANEINMKRREIRHDAAVNS